MSSLQCRAPYTDKELQQLYPHQLDLALVQVILRHGERAPTSARFQNAGLPQYWPYCNAARRLSSIALSAETVPKWDTLRWRRRLEFVGGTDDRATLARGPVGEVDGLCRPGELTDQGRRTTYQLGKRLRHLYITQLHFMPEFISDADSFYMRATEVSRAIESAQQTWSGMYPVATRSTTINPPTIIIRALNEETLFPNNFHCKRFAHLLREFGKSTASKWNTSPELQYVNDRISKWMPTDSPVIAVDSKPRLYGIMDTINATMAHGPMTRLPEAFYDQKVIDIIDKIACEEWYGGYGVNREFRTLGIGAYVGDIVDHMMTHVQRNTAYEKKQALQHKSELSQKGIKFALYGCHDVTLAAFLASFGVFEGQTWPQFSSHIAVELFRRKEPPQPYSENAAVPNTDASSPKLAHVTKMTDEVMGPKDRLQGTNSTARGHDTTDMVRRAWFSYSEAEKAELEEYYVRIRYNDQILELPGCSEQGRHLKGDKSFCTLEAFKRIADGFIPRNWKAQCAVTLDEPIVGLEKGTEQKPGHIEHGF